jgi:hypothetical protein
VRPESDLFELRVSPFWVARLKHYRMPVATGSVNVKQHRNHSGARTLENSTTTDVTKFGSSTLSPLGLNLMLTIE